MRLDVPFLPGLIHFFWYKCIQNTLVPAVWIKNEYQSDTPKDVAGSTSVSAAAGGRSFLQIRPRQ